MTKKVVKGSLWTLAGQVLPLAISLFTTPIVIRLLGSEGYGAMIFVLLIPGYFGFADLGMGMASTKFGSEAFAAGNKEKEASIVRTAVSIALAISIPFAAALFIFSPYIISLFDVPVRFAGESSLALRFASVTFVLNFLCLIVNTPQLTRLRMDLNSVITAVPRILGIIATPIVIYSGGGIAGATAVLLAVSILTLSGHLYVSGRLLPGLFNAGIDRESVKAMLKFGGGFAGAGIAGLLLVNLEKLVLTYTTSVEILAHYSVAFTLATMTTMFSAAMTQSLLPAFSQLLGRERQDQLNSLFSRALRLNLIVMLPLLIGLFVLARPLFTVWAGPEFGRESTSPFYVLLCGLFFNILAFVPASLVLASGRTGLLAKLYWLELGPYIVVIAIFTSAFGAVGAAAAWSVRAIADAFLIAMISRRTLGTQFRIFESRPSSIIPGFAVMAVPIVLTVLAPDRLLLLLIVFSIAAVIYSLVAWKSFISDDERSWLENRINGIFSSRK